MTRNFTAYSLPYQEKCFVAWYSAGRPNKIADLLDKLPKDEHDRIPSKSLLKVWREEQGWDFRADELDAKAITIVNETLVNQKAQMLQEHAKMAQELMQAGMKHIKDFPVFDSSSAAVSAIIRGAELERDSRGIGELIMKMSKMSDMDLEKEIMLRLARASEAGQIIDAEEDKGETVDNTNTDE